MKFPARPGLIYARLRSAALPAILILAIFATASSSSPSYTPSARVTSRGAMVAPDVKRDVKIQPLENAHFKHGKDLPCLGNAVEDGNPDVEASTVLIEMEKGCEEGWHYHSAESQIMIVSGQLTVQTFDTVSATLGPGGFFMLPSNERYKYSCGKKSKCLFFISLDRAFDYHEVKPAN